MGVVMVWGKLKIGLSTGEDEGGFSENKVHCVLRDTHAVSYLTRDTITHTIALTQKLINTHTEAANSRK